jgi:hypothetical protein
MKLKKSSYIWALKHLLKEGDTDLFPVPFEFKLIKACWRELLPRLELLEIQDYKWKAGRSMIIPKDNLGFRRATQLDPLDSLILTAIIFEFGKKIESLRSLVRENNVFSYRFKPSSYRFYGSDVTWHDFWRISMDRAKSSKVKYVLVTDIADFYNQIYHHPLEHQLSSALPDQVKRALMQFITKTTHGVSRGIPIGPHAVHLLAEAALISIDSSIDSNVYKYCRYVDDMHFFAKSKEEAELIIYKLVDILDSQQKLIPQKHKTKILSVADFIELAETNLKDRPLDDSEEKILRVISKNSNNDPYAKVAINEISANDLQFLSDLKITSLVEKYLSEEDINYVRFGWLLRRLTQVGTPGAIDALLGSMSKLTPVLGEVCRYIINSAPNYSGDPKSLGAKIWENLNNPIIHESQYLTLLLLDIYVKLPVINHLNEVTRNYSSFSGTRQRKIILAALAGKKSAWLKERKNDFDNADPWVRRAILKSIPAFPGDEGTHWLKYVKKHLDNLEKIVLEGTVEKDIGVSKISF